MRTPIIAVALLALTVPANAGKLRPQDRAWIETVHDFGGLYGECVFREPPLKEEGERLEDGEAASCKVADKLAKKLQANGYCIYARAGVGRPSKDRKHCYEIEWGD